MNHIRPLILIVCILLFPSCSNRDDTPSNNSTEFNVPATEDIIMYEINIGSFSSTGNLNGITARLDQIEALGINIIWLMPIHPVGILNGFGSPYSVKDYYSINPQLGEFEDLKRLVEEAHNRNIAVILDWVANHTAWDNPWITQHPEWYTQDGSGAIISPAGTNWTDVADLNFDNPQMRLEMISAMEFWIQEAGVDGFRCDAADLVPFDFWQQAINALEGSSDREIIMLAEGSRENHFVAGFQMNFAWDWYNTLKHVMTSNSNPPSLYATHTSEYASVPSGKRKLRFTTNHDLSNELTPIGVFGTKQAALAASVATIFMNGTPLLYSGQEVGISNPTIYTTGQTINWNLNPDMLSAYTSLLQFYKNSEVARKGTITYHNDADIIFFEKNLGSSKLLVIVNSDPSVTTLSIPNNLQGSWGNALANETITVTENHQLNGHEYVLLLRN